MDFIVDQLKFLGLNDREVKVFTAISTFGRMNMTKISSRSGLPRTTVDAIVRRLIEQGLLVVEKVRGHNEYAVHSNDVADKLDWIEKRIRTKTAPTISDEKVVIHDAFLDTLQEEMKMHAGDRVRVMFSQNGEGLEDCTLRLMQYIEHAMRYAIKLEILLGSQIADEICRRGLHFSHPENAHLIQLNIVPASYGVAEFDLFVFRDVLFLFHIRTKKSERITHTSIIELNKHLVGIACEAGWSINLTAWLKKI